MLALLPSLCLGFLVLAVLTAVASAGGREVVPRDQAVAFPVSTTTDHLGALLLAPLNIAWLLQAWTLLGTRATSSVRDRLLGLRAAGAAVDPRRDGAGAGGRLARRGRTPGPARHRGLPRRRGRRSRRWRGRARGHRPAADRARPQPRPAAPARRSSTRRAVGWRAVGRSACSSSCCSGSPPSCSAPLPARWALHRPMREELRLESGRHPGPADAALRPRDDAAHRPGRGLALGAAASRLMVLALMPGPSRSPATSSGGCSPCCPAWSPPVAPCSSA